jgi:hypothetical protein
MKFIASALTLLALSAVTVEVSAKRALKKGGGSKVPKALKTGKAGKSVSTCATTGEDCSVIAVSDNV